MHSAPAIKLFISSHEKDVAFPSCPLVEPIQVGAALAPEHFSGMLGDDTGDNISERNRSFCELTAQYWAWKNADADYYGFMHYRRYFLFTDERFDTNHFADVAFEANDDATLARMGYDEASIRKHVEPYDLIVPELGSFVDGSSIREQYERSWQHHIEDLECVLDIIAERHGEFLDVARRYLNGTEGYFCNMFIMRREVFDDYCAWLFDILFEHERRRGEAMANYDVQSYRVSGYLAERLCGIYLTWLIEHGVNYATLQRALFQDVSKPELLEPAFDDGVAIVLSSDDFYVPYLSALLQSIADTRSPERRYDIIVMTENISREHQEVLRKQVADDRLALRFLNVRRPMREYHDKLSLNGHFKIETYFRLLLGDLLSDTYHKILYLDSDMVVCHDLAELYDENLDGYLVGACRDADTAGLYMGVREGKREYMDNVLKIEKPFDYFQAGTVLFNLDLWRSTFDTHEVFAFAQSNDWQLLDQDVLNYLCQGHVKLLDMSWNVLYDWRGVRKDQICARAPRWLFADYLEARRHPYVVHFAGPDKPWYNPVCDYAEVFWEASRRTPFYEQILCDLTRDKARPKPVSLSVKETIYHGILAPAVERVSGGDTKRKEKLWAAYRKVHPVPDILD